MPNSNFVYRGSQDKLAFFDPKPVHFDDIAKLNNIGLTTTNVVWASPFKKNALAFAALSKIITFDLNSYHRDQPAESITFYTSDWQNQINPHQIVYCYGFDANNFIKFDDHEYVAIGRAVPTEVTEYTVREIIEQFKIEVKQPTI